MVNIIAVLPAKEKLHLEIQDHAMKELLHIKNKDREAENLTLSSPLDDLEDVLLDIGNQLVQYNKITHQVEHFLSQ